MYKLRRSRLMKFIAGILIIFLAAAVVGNIVGTIIIMDENLYYATRRQIQQKVYSYIYDYTASDLMRYLRVSENMYCNNDNYKNYHSSEIELYRSKYSDENSNIYFEIKDEHNNILLKNDTVIPDNYFTFSQIFITDTVYLDGWYAQGGSEKTDSVTEVQTTGFPVSPEAGETAEDETVYDNSFSEEIVITESTTVEEDLTSSQAEETVAGKPVPEIDKSALKSEAVTVDNINSDNKTAILYYYSGELNNKIFEYCKNITSNLSYDITDITFYQDDFYYSEYDEILCTYDANDFTIPTKTFTTNLIYEGKEVPVTYSYNGSLYFNEFESRLTYLSLILRNVSSDNLFFNYRQKGRLNLTVDVHVPYSLFAEDIYNAAEKLIDIAIVYRDNVVAITAIDIFLFILSLIFLFWSAGFIPKKDKPVARGLHAIPFDLFLFILTALSVCCLGLVSTYDDLFVITGITGLVFIALCLIYTIPVRIRAGTIKTNNLFYKLYKTIRSAAETLDETTGSRLKIFIALGIFLMISACEILFFIIIDMGSYGVGVILMFVRLAEVPFIAFLLTSLLALHNGAKQISKGDVGYRINHSFLLGPLKKHAQYLNSINDAVNNAVDERMRSESLKTELITNVSHDLKTPLTSIVNYVDLLKKTDIKDSKALEYIEVIDRQSQKLKKLTVDIVEASKAATGNIEVNYEKTALNVILLQTNGEYIERLEEKSLTLVQEIPDKDILVSTDGRLLWRVIDNLMNNICKYSMPGTRVYLSLWEHEGRAFISFRNISKTKLNISPDELTERFVRGDTSRNTEGSGLGLSIANSLTEIMGGKLSIIIDGDLFKVTVSFPTIQQKESE